MPSEKGVRPLYAILDAEVAAAAGWTLLDLASAYLMGGARFLQVRAKNASSGWLLEAASAIVERAHAAGAVVVINDRADIARLAGADGVHLGQEDLAPAAARVILDDAADASIVGYSTHTPPQMEAALLLPLSYVAVGPVFETATKATGHDAVGLQRVRDAAARARTRQLPLVAIGGITLDTAASVIDAGAASVAVISDLLAGNDPERRVRAYLKQISG